MTNWHIGQKVVCIKPDTLGFWEKVAAFIRREPVPLLEVGAIYTVAGDFIEDDQVWLEVEEIQDDWGFNPECFRPLVSPHTDISVFTSILDRVNQRETVRA